jgi:uncharacterized membrane protein YedE/YeeE
VLSLALAALLGFSIHRGSVCMVRGMAEVLSTGRAYMLLSFGKAVLWVLIVTAPVLWLAPAPGRLDHSWALSGSALAGGFLFGVGTAVNRGCAFPPSAGSATASLEPCSRSAGSRSALGAI